VETKKKLLYQEPRSSYLGDKIQDLTIPLIVIFFAQFALAFFILDSIIPGPLLPETIQWAVTLLLMLILAALATWTLVTFTSLLRIRERLEIFTDSINLPYPRTKEMKRNWKERKGTVRLQSIATATIEYKEMKLPLRSDRELWWECTFEMKNGQSILISRSGAGCYDWKCLEAIRRFVQIVDGRNSSQQL
jgi:ABC-type uncharacterized transport system fused permease/ATPase subunit